MTARVLAVATCRKGSHHASQRTLSSAKPSTRRSHGAVRKEGCRSHSVRRNPALACAHPPSRRAALLPGCPRKGRAPEFWFRRGPVVRSTRALAWRGCLWHAVPQSAALHALACVKLLWRPSGATENPRRAPTRSAEAPCWGETFVRVHLAADAQPSQHTLARWAPRWRRRVRHLAESEWLSRDERRTGRSVPSENSRSDHPVDVTQRANVHDAGLRRQELAPQDMPTRRAAVEMAVTGP
jgi:hypothetical protein